MKREGKLDYLEFQAGGGRLDTVKAFYATAFGWTFTDYGPAYSAFEEGIDGGFDASAKTETPPLPVLYSENLETTFENVADAGAEIVRPIFSFPGGRRFHFRDPAGNELAVWGT